MARIYHNEDENRNGDFVFEKRSSGNIIDVFYIPSLENLKKRESILIKPTNIASSYLK